MKRIKIRQATKAGYVECCEHGAFDSSYPTSLTRRGRVQGGGRICPTLLSQGIENINYIDKIMKEKTEKPKGKGWVWDEESGRWFRVRKLTPKECFRLMGVEEKEINKLLSLTTDKKGNEVQVISNSALYKCAGNSIVTTCLMGIYEQLFFPTETNVPVQMTLF